MQELAERMVNRRTFALGAIGGADVSVQLALDGRAVASMGSATEERRLNRGSRRGTCDLSWPARADLTGTGDGRHGRESRFAAMLDL